MRVPVQKRREWDRELFTGHLSMLRFSSRSSLCDGADGEARLIGVNLSEVTQLVRGLEEVQSQICVTSALRLIPPRCACSFEE